MTVFERFVIDPARGYRFESVHVGGKYPMEALEEKNSLICFVLETNAGRSLDLRDSIHDTCGFHRIHFGRMHIPWRIGIELRAAVIQQSPVEIAPVAIDGTCGIIGEFDGLTDRIIDP